MSASTGSHPAAPHPTAARPTPLTAERIVDAACLLIERDGFTRFSMRKLGAELGVDPMAVYHHVSDKRELLRLVTARTIGTMTPPDPTAPWDARTKQWAMRYWDLVVANRDLTLAGLADPAIAAGGLPSTEPLVAAIADSGLPEELIEPNAFIVVDAVHGSALGASSPARNDGDDAAPMRLAFEAGVDTIIAGIATRSQR